MASSGPREGQAPACGLYALWVSPGPPAPPWGPCLCPPHPAPPPSSCRGTCPHRPDSLAPTRGTARLGAPRPAYSCPSTRPGGPWPRDTPPEGCPLADGLVQGRTGPAAAYWSQHNKSRCLPGSPRAGGGGGGEEEPPQIDDVRVAAPVGQERGTSGSVPALSKEPARGSDGGQDTEPRGDPTKVGPRTHGPRFCRPTGQPHPSSPLALPSLSSPAPPTGFRCAPHGAQPSLSHLPTPR